jgi:hypothetical protein
MQMIVKQNISSWFLTIEDNNRHFCRAIFDLHLQKPGK